MTILILINLYIQDQYPGILYYLFSGLFSALFLLSLGYLSLGYLSASKILCIVLFAKLGLVPFHILLPNIYNNLSPQVILLMDIPYKMILFFVLYRLNFLFLDYSF
jgi:NADH:ubiquinone oxidoreductase subunit 2 (subunit N)